MPEKPFGGKSYGSIGHLPCSRLGSGDHCLTGGQVTILLEKVRDKHDLILVSEKLDGSNVGIGKLQGSIIPLTRSGYRAETSHWEQHHMFADWVMARQNRFLEMLDEGERLCGEWLAQVHGIHYLLRHEPFVAFDLYREGKRILAEELRVRCIQNGIVMPALLHHGGPCSVEHALNALGEHGHHGAQEEAEGAVWRVERNGVVDFLGKYVRPDKVDGAFLRHGAPEWNWRLPQKEENGSDLQ